MEENFSLLRSYYDKGIDDASSRGLIWYIRNMLYFEQKLESAPHVLLINYESLVSAPVQGFNAISAFLDIPFEVKVAKGIFISSVKKATPRPIDPDIEKLCQSLYNRLVELVKQ